MNFKNFVVVIQKVKWPKLMLCGQNGTYGHFGQYLEIFLFLSIEDIFNGNPLQYSCLENPMDGGAWCRLLSMGSQRFRHDCATSLHYTFFMRDIKIRPD